jgi:hypothetical protein
VSSDDNRAAGPHRKPASRRLIGAMRIDWLPFLVVFLVLTMVAVGALVALYALFNRLMAFLEKHEQ